MKQHTQGEWKFYPNKGARPEVKFVASNGREYLLADVYNGEANDAEANARLIAAAPKLLEALFAFMEADTARAMQARGESVMISPIEMLDGAYEQARAAIASAKGEA